MDNTNKELLSKVINRNLEYVLDNDAESEESKARFKAAMDAMSKQIEIEKIEVSHLEQTEKMKMEEIKNLRDEESKRDEARKDRWTQIGIFGAGLIVAPAIEYFTKKGFAKMLCQFEKDYTFTTTAGRTLSGLFKFKK